MVIRKQKKFKILMAGGILCIICCIINATLEISKDAMIFFGETGGVATDDIFMIGIKTLIFLGTLAFMLVAGIFGVTQKYLKACFIFGIIMVAVALLSPVVDIFMGQLDVLPDDYFLSSLYFVPVPIVYTVGAFIARKREKEFIKLIEKEKKEAANKTISSKEKNFV